MLKYPPRLPLAQLPTPLQPLRRLQHREGGPLIWLKRDDMTGATLSGNKVRKLEFILAQAQLEGFDAVITCGGIQSNHCRATALAAAQLGFACHLILRGMPEHGQPAQGNHLLDELAGASIEYAAPKEYFAGLDDIFRRQIDQYERLGKKALAIPTGGSNGIGIWGYIEATRELMDDCVALAFDPTAIICASGSGGTQAGLTVGAAIYCSGAKVYGINVCDDEDYFVNKVSADVEQWRQINPEASAHLKQGPLGIHVIGGYVGAGYGQADKDVFDTIKMLGALEGVVLDPVYTGKAFDGLLKEIRQGRFADEKNLIFVHTGGVFGLAPYAADLSVG